jgi:hypothetical protein
LLLSLMSRTSRVFKPRMSKHKSLVDLCNYI